MTHNDFILPIFLIDGKNKKQEIKSMPGVYRYTLDKINSVVDLSASINNGWVISGWNNATRSEDDITSATVLMSNDVVVTATFTQDIEGQNYYFSSVSGNDANPGTIEAPLQTVDAINSKVFYPGDSILFKYF